jgi:hypothetical protein
VGEIEKLVADYEERHRFWRENLPQGALREAFLQKSYEPGKQYLSISCAELIPAAQRGDTERFDRLFKQAEQVFAQHRAAIDETVALATQQVQQAESGAAAVIRTRLLVLTLLGLFVLGVLGYMAFGVMRNLLGNVRQLQHAISELASNNLSVQVPTTPRDVLHSVMSQFNQDDSNAARIDPLHSADESRLDERNSGGWRGLARGGSAGCPGERECVAGGAGRLCDGAAGGTEQQHGRSTAPSIRRDGAGRDAKLPSRFTPVCSRCRK